MYYIFYIEILLIKVNIAFWFSRPQCIGTYIHLCVCLLELCLHRYMCVCVYVCMARCCSTFELSSAGENNNETHTGTHAHTHRLRTFTHAQERHIMAALKTSAAALLLRCFIAQEEKVLRQLIV